MFDVFATALAEGRTVSFVYDNRPRIVEVHAVGHSTKDDSIVIRGYQVAGESSCPLPCWALFTLDKVEAPTLGFPNTSEAPRPGYKMGDKQMSKILIQIHEDEDALVQN